MKLNLKPKTNVSRFVFWFLALALAGIFLAGIILPQMEHIEKHETKAFLSVSSSFALLLVIVAVFLIYM